MDDSYINYLDDDPSTFDPGCHSRAHHFRNSLRISKVQQNCSTLHSMVQ